MITAGVSTVIAAIFAAATLQAKPDGIPQYVSAAAETYGAEYNIAPELLEAIAYTESRYQPDAENGSCKGLMQISVRWHEDRMERLRTTDIYDADQNMHIAADYLGELFRKYEDTGLVLLKYNGADKSKIAHYEETGELTEYAQSILDKSEELERVHGK